ncbi:MAG TPA: hypothetical protein VK481_04740 [Gemmatimonadaceae bacterium]|jgi:hypothetical protein|nr:hypothetical protein [Gemmatimonadaceae bacterium]
MIFRRVATAPEKPRRKVSASFLVSLAVHVVVVIAFMRMLILNADFSSATKRQSVPQERVGFVRLSNPNEKPTPGKSGGDGRPEKSREIHVTPPAAVPSTIPAPTTAVTKPDDDGGTGPLVGGGGPVRGVRPNYSDGRLWTPPNPIVAPPKTVAQTIDSLIADAIAPYNDSIARVAQERDPTDWTVKKGGYKWGIDKRAIRLGPFSIPTAVLAMLPLNITGNPTTMDRERSYAAMNRDINFHAQQAINDADFMKAVRSIRERKERERAAALAGASSKDGSGSGDQRQ